MKTATIPPLRVDPKLRQDAENVLQEGETLSSFVEQSLRMSIDHRKAQQEFIARGLASSAAAKRSGKYFSAEEVLTELDAKIAQARARARK